MGVPRDDRMDGRVLPFATPVGEVQYDPREETDVESTEDVVVQERLSDLGYLE
jgi:hypothetical protein